MATTFSLLPWFLDVLPHHVPFIPMPLTDPFLPSCCLFFSSHPSSQVLSLHNCLVHPALIDCQNPLYSWWWCQWWSHQEFLSGLTSSAHTTQGCGIGPNANSPFFPTLMLTYADECYLSSNYQGPAVICWWNEKAVVVLNALFMHTLQTLLQGIALMAMHFQANRGKGFQPTSSWNLEGIKQVRNEYQINSWLSSKVIWPT